jgi:hypothetical protein
MEKKAKKSLSSKFNSLFDENKRKFKKYNAGTKKTNKKKLKNNKVQRQIILVGKLVKTRENKKLNF